MTMPQMGNSLVPIGAFIAPKWHILCGEVGTPKCILFKTVRVKIDTKWATSCYSLDITIRWYLGLPTYL